MELIFFLGVFGLTASVAMIVVRHRGEKSNGRWIGGPWTNLAAFSLGVAIVSYAIIFFSAYRDDARAEERDTLRQVAAAQRQLLKEDGEFGYKADVISVNPELFDRQFEIENGDRPGVTYITTPRCKMALIGKRDLGPLCGPAR